MCGGGNTGAILGAVLGAALAPATGGLSLALGATGAAVAGGAVGALAGDALVDKPAAAQQKALEVQQVASEKAQVVAEKQATLAQEANNKANAKSPDVGAMISANTQAAKGGASGTMLTGPQGVDYGSLNLGKNTLLGS